MYSSYNGNLVPFHQQLLFPLPHPLATSILLFISMNSVVFFFFFKSLDRSEIIQYYTVFVFWRFSGSAQTSKVLIFFFRRIMRLVLTCVLDFNSMGAPHPKRLLIPW